MPPPPNELSSHASGIPAHALVDSIVCAAAEAMGLPPQALRPALRAAFSRAEEIGISVQAVLGVLAPALEVDLGDDVKDSRTS
jgi:hypothetical protein